MKHMFFFTGIAMLLASCASNPNWRELSAAEIRHAFTDKTIDGENYWKGKTITIYAGPEGQWIANPGGLKMLHFKWYVTSAGEHCKEGRGEHGCGPIYSKGEPNVYYKFVNGEERFKFTIIGDGNQL